MRNHPLAATLGLSLALAAGAASAQPSGEDRVEEARNQYRAGVAAFQRGRFGDATLAFERSFRARPHPATLYNAAEARMRAGDAAGALAQLRDLLAMTDPAPEPDLAGRARNLALQMGERDLQPTARVENRPCPECPTCPPPQEAPPPPPPERIESRVSPAAWVLAGGALALTAAGAAFFAVAVDNASSFENTTDRALQESLRDQGETYRVIGVAGMVLGVGAAVGAAWMFTHPTQRRAPAERASMSLGVYPGGLSVSGRF